MSERAGAAEILGKATELEKTYGWVEAAVLYEQALPMVGKKDFLKKGVVQERIGYCLRRGAFQAETQEQFKSRMLKAVKAYERARGFYEKPMDEQKTARVFRCEAIAKYLGYWLTSDPSDKRALLDECLELEGKALTFFSESDDMLEYGRTYNELWLVPWLRANLDWNRHSKESIIEMGLEWGETTVAALAQLGASHELARAYHTLSICLGLIDDFIVEPKDQEENHLKIVQNLSDVLRFSEKIGDHYLSGKAHQLLGSRMAVAEESMRHCEQALECGKQTQDNFRIAASLQMLAYWTSVKSKELEDPEKWREQRAKALQFYDKAQHHSSIISFVFPMGGLMGPPSGYIEHYLELAERETNARKSLEFLKKAEKAGLKALKLAENSEIPPNVSRALSCVAACMHARSLRESDLTEKKTLLETALEYHEKSTEICEEQEPFFYANRGTKQTSLARVKMQLADIEPDFATKQRLLNEAVSHMEKGLKLCNKKMPIYEKRGFTMLVALLQGYQDIYATMLTLLYDLTKDPKHLRKSVEISQKAVNSAKKLDLVSRVAESYWKIAKAQGILGDHLNAAENYERASESYTLAAAKIAPLKGFYSDYALYMKAWAELEKARHVRENEDYAQSKKHYQKGSCYLETTKRWAYLSTYYFAWSLLEHGEELSRRDKPQDSVLAFDEAGRAFADSVNSLRMNVGKLESSEEQDEVSRLVAVAGLRKQYCIGRGAMEEAKLLNRKGDRISSARAFASAARLLEGIAPNFEREEARRELEFAATLCRAWENMELAEERREPALFKKAAELFAEAGEITHKKTAGLLAVGNSCFCEALELGTKFMATSKGDFYSGAKLRMENAANYYQRAGFEKAALWVDATKRLLDAHVYAGKAEVEVEPEKRARFYLMAEKCLELSANFFGKAGYPEKRKEALQSLERVRKERRLALSLSEVLAAPTLLSSTTGISMPDSTEQATGLNEFESVNVRARLSVPDEFVPGEEFQVKLDLINVGKKPGLLVRVEGLVPRRCEVLKMPSYCALEDESLSLKGKRLDPLAVESVGVWLQVTEMVGLRLSPRVVYVDELGNFRTIRVERAQILPAVTFESEDARAIFTYLVDAFVEDSMRRRRSVEQAGWRSLPQIMKSAGVSKRSVYGAGGQVGSGLAELRRTGLVDLGTFRGRGRGGHILKARIHRENELVRRYVREQAPDLSM